MPERLKIEKFEKLVANLHANTKHITNLKQTLNHGLVLEKIHRIIKFNQTAQLKPYIDMNTDLRKTVKNEFEKNLFKLMNHASFGKTMENVRKSRDIEIVATERRRYYLVTEQNYHTTKYKVFRRNFISNRNEKIRDIYE